MSCPRCSKLIKHEALLKPAGGSAIYGTGICIDCAKRILENEGIKCLLLSLPDPTEATRADLEDLREEVERTLVTMRNRVDILQDKFQGLLNLITRAKELGYDEH